MPLTWVSSFSNVLESKLPAQRGKPIITPYCTPKCSAAAAPRSSSRPRRARRWRPRPPPPLPPTASALPPRSTASPAPPAPFTRLASWSWTTNTRCGGWFLGRQITGVHLRSAKKLLRLCEVNRGFYVKAGQFVSSLRQVPKEYISTLSCLQDQATPCKYQDIKIVIEQNFGKDLHDIFLEFDEHPIAAASIAQVHRGRLNNNQEVAVKVQYPGLERRMKLDIMTMSLLSKYVSLIFPDYRFEKILLEFERTMSMELDFTQEAKNSERTARCFRKNDVVKIPHVFWELTTKEVLTMEFCTGHKVDDLDFLRKADISPTKVAKALIELFGEMIFIHGFVHGDPHPGNILVSPRGQGRFSLVLLDHGIYKELDPKFRLDYCKLWKALISLDVPKILELGEQFGVGKYAKYFPLIFTGRTIYRHNTVADWIILMCEPPMTTGTAKFS
ncbi:aarF domain-containing protein kinase 1 isoform X5 [Triticum urartu]|uniref:aarF domain-containing protein kinase 1 isoform X5 n=1 Tax=Triticum urartu TaxID=4572 RepID=UPI002044996B|nr:aarF domain-containing protein kinase 1 isoform X5 [Triticum urartu]